MTMPFATTWADLEMIRVSEASQTKTNIKKKFTPRDDLPLKSDCFSKLSA